MKIRYGSNSSEIDENVSQTAQFTPILIFAGAIPILFCFIGLFHFVEKNDSFKTKFSAFHAILWTLLIVSVIGLIMSNYYYRNKEIKKAAAIQGGLVLTVALFGFFFSINEHYDNFQPYLWIFTGIAFVFIVIYFYSVFSKAKKFLPVIENIKQCFLELYEDHICGYCFNNIEVQGDGHYFEIKYNDIRNVRFQTTGYYNFFIDHSNGTYKLAIEKAFNAKNNIEKIIKIVKEGKTPTEEDIYQNITTSDSTKKAFTYTPYGFAPREIKCFNCGEILPKSSCKCDKCGEINYRQTDIPIKVFVDQNGEITCPICKTTQKGSRYRCFKCGQYFINGQSTPYWCKKCGNPAPYEDQCPVCGSSERIINDTIKGSQSSF